MILAVYLPLWSFAAFFEVVLVAFVLASDGRARRRRRRERERLRRRRGT